MRLRNPFRDPVGLPSCCLDMADRGRGSARWNDANAAESMRFLRHAVGCAAADIISFRTFLDITSTPQGMSTNSPGVLRTSQESKASSSWAVQSQYSLEREHARRRLEPYGYPCGPWETMQMACAGNLQRLEAKLPGMTVLGDFSSEACII